MVPRSLALRLSLLALFLAGTGCTMEQRMGHWHGHHVSDLEAYYGRPSDVEVHGDHKVYTFKQLLEYTPEQVDRGVYDTTGHDPLAPVYAPVTRTIVRRFWVDRGGFVYRHEYSE